MSTGSITPAAPKARILLVYEIGRRTNAALASFFGARANVIDLLFAEPPTAAEWRAVAELVAGRHCRRTWIDNEAAFERTLARLLTEEAARRAS